MKKNFKKIAAVALSCVLTLGMTVNAFAADLDPSKPDQLDSRNNITPTGVNLITLTGGSGETSRDVKVTIKKSETPVYRVDVTWESMDFVYDLGDGLWNPENHKFDTTNAKIKKGDAEDADSTIKVTNHSNAKMNIKVTYAASATANGFGGNVSNGEFSLNTAVGTVFGSAPNNTATLTLNATNVTDEGFNDNDNFTVGTVKVTISPATT